MKKVVAFLFGFLLCTSLALAIDVTFRWGASTGQVDGYRIYSADIQGGPYSDKIYEGNGTTLNCILPLLETQEYYFVCRAFNGYGESGDSNEIHWAYVMPEIPGMFYWSIDLATIMKSLGADRIRFVGATEP